MTISIHGRSADYTVEPRDPLTLDNIPKSRVTKEYVPDDSLKEGVKYDGDKPRYDLIPADSLHELAKLYQIGAIKYDERNWEKGMKWSRIFRALLSHAWAWWRGERYDQTDGQPHLASVAWCALALLSYEMREIGEDNRPVL